MNAHRTKCFVFFLWPVSCRSLRWGKGLAGPEDVRGRQGGPRPCGKRGVSHLWRVECRPRCGRCQQWWWGGGGGGWTSRQCHLETPELLHGTLGGSTLGNKAWKYHRGTSKERNWVHHITDVKQAGRLFAVQWYTLIFLGLKIQMFTIHWLSQAPHVISPGTAVGGD